MKCVDAKRSWITCVVCAIILMWTVQLSVSPQSVLAEATPVPNADGQTVRTSSYCSARVFNVDVPEEIDVDDYDPLVFEFYVEWIDTRSYPAWEVIHRFGMVTLYQGYPYGDGLDKKTYGDESGDDTLLAEVPDVFENTSITVTWSAQMIQVGTCVVSDQSGPHEIDLV